MPYEQAGGQRLAGRQKKFFEGWPVRDSLSLGQRGEYRLRGQHSRSGSLFFYVNLEQRVRANHPLRTIRTLVNEALASLDGRFGEIPSEIGRPSIPPE